LWYEDSILYQWILQGLLGSSPGDQTLTYTTPKTM
jgi:hypothetical protein